MKHNLLKMALFVSLASVLAGCGGTNGSKQARTSQQRHPIKIEKAENSLEIPISQDGYISEAEEANIKSFLYQYDNYGTSSLIITAPETGVEAGKARTFLRKIVEIANKVGIKQSSIKMGTYQALDTTSAVVRLNFETMTAKAPDCSNSWSENLADAAKNELSKGHGCTTQKNFAAMLVNPQELVEMRSMSAVNAQRGVAAFDKYLAGQIQAVTASATDQ